MLRGLTEHDSIEELGQRLQDIPKDLEAFSQKILESVDEFYKPCMAKALLLTLHAAESLPLLSFWCLRIDMANFQWVSTLHLERWRVPKVRRVHEDAPACVNEWSRDLLKVNWLGGEAPEITSVVGAILAARVEFLHRSVRDFLRTPEVQSTIMKQAGPSFDPWLILCRLTLALTKFANIDVDNTNDVDRFFNIAGNMTHYAKQYEIRAMATPQKLLEELDSVRKAYWVDAAHHWSNYGTTWGFQAGWTGSAPMDFTTYAAAFGLEVFVRYSAEELTDSRVCNQPLLLYTALRQIIPHALCCTQFPNVDMARLLLHHGADPNRELRIFGTSRTVWERYLCDIVKEPQGTGLLPPSLTIAKMFLENGCDHRIQIPSETDDKYRVSARECLRYACPQSELEDLGKSYQEAVARSSSFQGLLLMKFASHESWHSHLDSLKIEDWRSYGSKGGLHAA